MDTLIYIADLNHVIVLNDNLSKPLIGNIDDVIKYTKIVLIEEDVLAALQFATNEGHNALYFGVFGNFMFSRIAIDKDKDRVKSALGAYL